MKVTVTRAFLLGGRPQKVGETVEVPDHLGRELVALNKAAPATPLPQRGPMTTKTAAAVVSGAAPAAAATATATPAAPAAPAAKKATP